MNTDRTKIEGNGTPSTLCFCFRGPEKPQERQSKVERFEKAACARSGRVRGKGNRWSEE